MRRAACVRRPAPAVRVARPSALPKGCGGGFDASDAALVRCGSERRRSCSLLAFLTQRFTPKNSFAACDGASPKEIERFLWKL